MSQQSRGLSRQAYEPVPDGGRYEPYVDPASAPAEFTLKAVGAGILFGIAFGAANAYLGLQAGLTISTSIPVAVLTVACFRTLRAGGIQSSLLEANTSQTVGSASSSVASGVIFTLPALFLWELDPSLAQMTVLAACGGLLGVLFMIPLRQFLIEREHGHLPYPEGTACAEVLVASDIGGSRARPVFLGLIVGALFKASLELLTLIERKVTIGVPLLKKGAIGLKISPALFGVGYILGPRIATIMVSGGLLSSLVIIPVIALWGEGRGAPLYPETEVLIQDMSPSDIWERYVRYLGAGSVATAGIMTLIRSIPTMIESFRIGAAQMRNRVAGQSTVRPRTSQDLPLKSVAIGAAVIALVLTATPFAFGTIDSLGARAAAALLVVLFAFFFVTVSSRIVGLVGVTSNPTSGMTIAALLGTSFVFLSLGWTDASGKAAALCVGCVVAIAASIAGDTSQDLKTGFLLGATPRRQQIGELIGVLTSAAFVCGAVILLDKQPGGGFGSENLPAPQATLMQVVIDGVLEQTLPWGLVGIGAGIAVIVQLLGIPSLPFAVGVYLPVSTMLPVFCGGLLRHRLARRSRSEDEQNQRRETGILFGSGLVGGEGLLGVAVAGLALAMGRAPEGVGTDWAARVTGWSHAPDVVALLAFALLVLFFRRICRPNAAVGR